MATNSGQKQTVFNTLERLLSGDLNQLQTFGAAALAESVRRLVGRTVRPVAPGPGQFPVDTTIDPTTLTTPLTAVVLGGLLVNPQGAQLLIDGGVLAAVFPGTGGADDSVLALVTAPDVNPGLAFPPNAGSTRWDLVEVTVTEAVVESTQSRDIYNPATKTFAAALVPKVEAGQLSFRIRSGVVGGPIPSPAAGWLPIAALFHNGVTASFDDVAVYDVRPLVDDRDGTDRTGTWGHQRNQAEWVYNRTTGLFTGRVRIDDAPGGDSTLTGFSDGSGALGLGLGMRASGAVLGGLRGEDDPEVTLAAHLQAGTVLTTDSWYGLWLVFPANLPRWRKLSDLSVGGRRWPIGCGGILVVGPGTAPPNFGAGGLCPLPAGLGDTVPHRAVMFGVMRTRSGSAVFASADSNVEGWTQFEEIWSATTVAQTNPSAGTLAMVFSLQRGTGISGRPLPDAPIAGIRCRAQGIITGASPGSAKQIAPVAFVAESGPPALILGDFAAFADYTVLPGADTLALSDMVLRRADSANNNGLQGRGAPIPWNFSVLLSGFVGAAFNIAPTAGQMRFSGVQFKV